MRPETFGLFPVAVFLFLLLAAQGCAAPLKSIKPMRQGITRAGYSVQVGAFREVKNAERLSTKLQEKGVEAYYFRKDDGVYAVRFGDYTSREAARKSAARFQKEKLITSYFVASPQDAALRQTPPAEMHKPADISPAHKKPSGDMGSIAARTAERFVGIPYKWGGDTVVDGMDCSGFVRAVYNLCGINIPRTSREQYRAGDSVDRESLVDGDLVFFGASESSINHVGIYVGNGKFVHAPRRGEDIKVSEIEESYFVKKYVGARRYF